MSNQVWFITGSARGMGVDLAKAALAAGHSVVATARDAAKVAEALGEHQNLLALSLDITDPAASTCAAEAAVQRFGRVDVLVNNAGNFYAGYFEEISDQQIRKQMETNFFGPLNVTRAILPVMREQRGGRHHHHLCRRHHRPRVLRRRRVKVRPRRLDGIPAVRRRPVRHRHHHRRAGFFRTELLVEGASSIWPELSIEDYADRTAETIAVWKSMNGQQGGDPRSSAPPS